MKCEKCGFEAPERAVICPECGEILPRVSAEEQQTDAAPDSVSDRFSMPYLSASADEIQDAEDPRKLHAEEKIHRAVIRRRIIALVIAAVLVIGITLYVVFLGGYKLAAFRYIKGVDYASGSMYLALVPDPYLDYLEDTYDTTRRDVKESLGDYFTSWNANYGNAGSMSYEITSRSQQSESQIESLEEELKTAYGITVDIRKAVEVSFRVNDGGDVASEHAVFVKIGMKWCCMEAMEQIDYVCQYDGYGQW